MNPSTITIEGVRYVRARAIESEVVNLRKMLDLARDSNITYVDLVHQLKAAVERLEHGAGT